MLRKCTYGATLEDLLGRPMGMLALHGRDGEDDGAKPKDKAESDDDAKSKNDDEENDDGEDDEADKGKGKKDEDTVPVLKRKLENAEEARNRAVDKRDEYKAERDELKVKIAKLEKDGSPDETLKADNETLTAENATLAATNQRLMLEIALRDDTAHDWVNPDAVLKLADLSDVDFDSKTNKPRGLKAALDKLAKDSPYLLKPKDDANDDKGGKPGQRGTGKPPAPKGTVKGAEEAARVAKLRNKYPALRRG